jgi:hypothetical protein
MSESDITDTDHALYAIEAVRLRIQGMPDWMLTDPYDIEAIADRRTAPVPSTAKQRNERIRGMLQAIMADRLHLRVRWETLQDVIDRLRLKLERTKAPIPVLIIEHVEKPSEN